MPTPLETALAAAQATVTAVQNIVVPDVTALQATIAARDATIATQTATIAARDATIATLTNDKAGLQTALNEQTARTVKAVALNATRITAAQALTDKLTQLLPSQGGPAI